MQGLCTKPIENINTAAYWNGLAEKEMGEVEEFKQKELLDMLVRDAAAKPAVSILDVGCARGALCQAVFEVLRDRGVQACVHGVDISDRMIRAARAARDESLVFHAADVHEFLRDAPGYDYIISNHTLEHIPNIPALVQAISQHTDNFIFEIPYGKHIDSEEHVNHFDETFMAEQQRRCRIIDRNGSGWVVMVAWLDLRKWRHER